MSIVTSTNFSPISSVQLAVGAASASVSFPTLPTLIGATYMITNTGSAGAYIVVGIDSAVAAATTSTPSTTNVVYISAGSTQILDYPPNYNTVAAIQATAATTLEISLGKGN